NRLLEKDPAKRFSDSEQLAAELKTCLDQLPDSIEASKRINTNQSLTGSTSGSQTSSIIINLPALRTRYEILSLVGFAVLLALIGYWFFPTSGSQATPANNKIAVLPLESISTEPEDIQFTDGVHEELINRLAGISELTVIGRSSVLGFEPGQRDMESIGQQLGVSSLMEGTVRRIGDQLRVSIQLIDANSLATVWSGSFDDNIDDVFEIQSRIARQVAGELQASLTADEQEQLNIRPTDNPQAFRYYMQGRAFLSRGVFDEENLFMAEQLLRNAVEQDPEFAQAWGMLAYAYSQLYWFYQRNQETLKNLERAAEWALFYGPDHAETYLANGVFLFWTSKDSRQTLSHFESAVQKYPNDSLILFMTAYTHRSLGNWKELFDYLKRALELDPLNINIHTELAYDYLLIRNYDKALEYVERFRELAENPFYFVVFTIRSGLAKNGTLEVYENLWDQINTSDPAIEEPMHYGHYNRFKRNWDEALRSYKNSNDIYAQYFIGTVLERLGNKSEALTYYEAAKNDWEQLLEEYPNNPIYRSALGKVYTRLGNIDKAIQEGKRALEISSTQPHYVGTWFEYDLAEIYAWSSNEELAIDLLEYCLSVPSEEAHRNILRLDPIWDPLRDNPRFQEIIAGEDEPYIEDL
ncbi:tetratricopeptide repeat protein, partial [Rhodohalobacter sulfatireducens]